MIEVVAAGLFSTLQDGGRFTHRNIGVPVSGWMDSQAAQLANTLVNNQRDSTVLEMTYQGATLKFTADTFIAVTGAPCSASINGKLIENNRVHRVVKGDLLKIARATHGVYIYLSVAGGFKTEEVLDSCSYYKSITKFAQLIKGQQLYFNHHQLDIINRSVIKPDNDYLSNNDILVTKGPEFSILDQNTQMNLFNQSLIISANCNRMAYKLTHKQELKADEIITSSVQPGTVQLTPSGELMVLMRDCQTTGGYARILQLTTSEVNKLAQKFIGQNVTFNLRKL